MKRNALVTGVGIALILMIAAFAGAATAQNPLSLQGLKFMGDFEDKVYEPMPGNPPVRLTAEMRTWPGEFYDPPDVLIVRADVVNSSGTPYRDVIIRVRVRYKVGRWLNDSEERLMEQASKQTAKWRDYHIDKAVKVASVSAHGKVTIDLAKIPFDKDMDRFQESSDMIWECEAAVKFIKPSGLRDATVRLPVVMLAD